MRIFLTEFTYKGQTHDGPDIIAETREIAEKTAKRNALMDYDLLIGIGFNLLFLLGLISLKIWADRRVERNMKAYLKYLKENKKYDV